MQPKLDANTEEIKQLKLDFEVPHLATAPENCGEAIDLGVKTSRFITLDPDGQSVKEEPILGFCEVPTGTTILDTDVTVEVQTCDSLHCFQHNMTYAAPLQQMVALIDTSGNCSQSIKVDCLTAPLQVSLVQIQQTPWLMQTLLLLFSLHVYIQQENHSLMHKPKN